MFMGLPQLQVGQAKARSEILDIIYLDIQDYLEKVTVENPQHCDALEGLGKLLISNDYFGIGDVAGKTAEWFIAEPFHTI